MLTDWTKRAIANSPTEAKIIRKVIRALKENGTPVVRVDDTEELNEVTTEHDILNEVFGLDESYLITSTGSWVRLVMGNDEDVICDYTVSLEKVIKPIFDWIEKTYY